MLVGSGEKGEAAADFTQDSAAFASAREEEKGNEEYSLSKSGEEELEETKKHQQE